jgi:hypothetical protein
MTESSGKAKGKKVGTLRTTLLERVIPTSVLNLIFRDTLREGCGETLSAVIVKPSTPGSLFGPNRIFRGRLHFASVGGVSVIGDLRLCQW